MELKAPHGGGKLSEKQEAVIGKYRRNNYATLVSSDYDQILVAIMEYMKNSRTCCSLCSRKFKTQQSLGQHLKFVHKVENIKVS